MKSVQQFWYENFTTSFFEILDKYENKVSLIIGAHIHQADLRAPMSSKFSDLSIPLLSSPSVSPIFMNNPGYSMLDFNYNDDNDDSLEIDYNWRFMQLYVYIATKIKVFITMKP